MIQIFTEPPKDFDFTKKISRCVINFKHKILILQNTTPEQLWEIPGGKLESGETPKEAAFREVFEEAGLRLDENQVTKVCVLFLRSEKVDFVLYMFKGELKESKEISLSGGHQKYKWVTAEELSTYSLLPGSLQAFDYYQQFLDNMQSSKAFVNSHLLPIKNNHVLLALRENTGFCDGCYSLIAGHVEHSESARAALVREAEEEAGLLLSPEQLELVHIRHHIKDRNNVSFFFSCTDWEGEAVNLEPHKCGGFAYFPLNQLPSNTVPYVKEVIQHITEDTPYSDNGW